MSRLHPIVVWIAVLTGCSTPADDNLRAFETALDGNPSATAVLEQWCALHHPAEPAIVRAERIRGDDRAPSPATRTLLQVTASERLQYRHVRLICGGVTMSVAHNWYVAARLSPEMNTVLETSDAPFGKVVKPLGFRRERLETTHGGDPGCPRDTVLAHHAVLRLADGRPFSLVIECYTAANLSDEKR